MVDSTNLILEFHVTKDNLLATIPSWGPNYKASLQIWIESFSGTPVGGYFDLLRFTNTNNNYGNPGDRIPALFVNKAGYIYASSQVGSNPDNSIIFDIKARTWTNVEIKQYLKSGKVDDSNIIIRKY